MIKRTESGEKRKKIRRTEKLNVRKEEDKQNKKKSRKKKEE